jgi:hypothetical protein
MPNAFSVYDSFLYLIPGLSQAPTAGLKLANAFGVESIECFCAKPCSLCILCISVVNLSTVINHRATENAEIAQRQTEIK